MNFMLVIVNNDNNLFSKFKKNSPKMLNNMKDLCLKYKEMFGNEYKVKRVLITPKGYKLI